MSFHLYADDTQIYTAFGCDDDAELCQVTNHIENCLMDITSWMTVNKLKHNSDKTELLLFRSKFRPSPMLPSITVGTDTIYPTEKARDIGVNFDSNMTMSPQVNNIVKATFYHLRKIAKVRKFISPSTTEVLIHAFVSSKLYFCNALFYGIPKYQIRKLQYICSKCSCLCGRVLAQVRPYI